MSRLKSRSAWASLALFSALAISSHFVSAEEAPTYSNDIARLYQISLRLETLNARLQSELRECKTNLLGLRLQLATSGLELQTLTRQLDESRNQIDALEKSNQTSREELAALRILQRKAESSLESLEYSLDAYRRKAEAEIRKWKGVSIGAGVGGAAIGIVLGVLLRGNVK